jgi:type I restriction enzyme S subunit
MSKWIETKLRGKIHVKHGFPFKGEYFATEGEYIVLTPGNFYEVGGFKREKGKEKFYLGDIPEEYVHEKGDLIVAMTEQTDGLLGSCALIPESGIYLHNQRLGLITAIGEVDKTFLYYLFKTKLVRSQLSGSASGTKVKHTSPERIYDLSVYLPRLNEQKKIAAVLSSIDQKIEINNRINAELEAMAKTLYDYWFVQFDFPDENGKPYKSSGGKMLYSKELKREIPASWEVKKLSDMFFYQEGPGITKEKYSTDGHKFINIKSIKNDDLDVSDASMLGGEFIENYKHFLLDVNDIVLSTSGSLGRSAVVRKFHLPLLLNTSVIRFKALSADLFEYLYFYLKSDFFIGCLNQLATGSIQKNFGPTHLDQMTDVFPDQKTMRDFHNKIKTSLSLILKNKTELDYLKELRDWLLPMLMNGQVRVDDKTA